MQSYHETDSLIGSSSNGDMQNFPKRHCFCP